MNDTFRYQVNVDNLMRQLAAEAARRRRASGAESRHEDFNGSGEAEGFDRLDIDEQRPVRIRLPESRLKAVWEAKPRYSIDDFLRYWDAEFVGNAYRGILRREPDRYAWEHYLTELRSGKYHRVEILGRLRYSTEGRARAVPVRGLAWRFLVVLAVKVPVLGYLLDVVRQVVRLPSVVRSIELGEAASQLRGEECRELLDSLAKQTEALVGEVTHPTLQKLKPDLSAAIRGRSLVPESAGVGDTLDHPAKASPGAATNAKSAHLGDSFAKVKTDWSHISAQLAEIRQRLTEQERSLAKLLACRGTDPEAGRREHMVRRGPRKTSETG